MNTMIDLQKLPYEIGDKIMHNGKPHTIKGIHLYIGGGGGAYTPYAIISEMENL